MSLLPSVSPCSWLCPLWSTAIAYSVFLLSKGNNIINYLNFQSLWHPAIQSKLYLISKVGEKHEIIRYQVMCQLKKIQTVHIVHTLIERIIKSENGWIHQGIQNNILILVCRENKDCL